jgi:hypothetical protein
VSSDVSPMTKTRVIGISGGLPFRSRSSLRPPSGARHGSPGPDRDPRGIRARVPLDGLAGCGDASG